ncbi:hypothetical protein F6V30_02650 [Oryzomonas sagensis]|uniref:Porin n=1 Tax=Oryzomonas sagensis TaxID=2603857 RepID=A0ABQ6TRB2_9BACT|nr:hypothetical protein [Oryzomonas sagensis]KAB0671497.1 hypothetical protein F6V30_02650 [Oryzomonas sagensis]
MKIFWGLSAVALLLASPAMADEPVKSKFDLSIGGYVKLDYAYNSVKLNSPKLIPQMPAGGTASAQKDESTFTARESRLWFRAKGPDAFGAKTGSLVEVDFYGGGSSVNNETGTLRIRHAYGTLDWDTTHILFGQTWDIFGPAAANTVDFSVNGFTGTPNCPRVAQLRVTQDLAKNQDNKLSLMLGLQNPQQEYSTLTPNSYGPAVNAAGRLIYESKALGVAPGIGGKALQPLQVTLFGEAGTQKVTGNKAINVYGYGIYGFVPLLKSANGKNRAMTLSLETQAYIAAGLGDQQATGASTTGTLPNMSAARGFGVYGQLIFYPLQDMGVTAGYGRRQSMDYDSLGKTASAAGERYNQLIYANLAYDLNAAVRVATEYEFASTRYNVKPTGANSELGKANIYRLALYYYF